MLQYVVDTPDLVTVKVSDVLRELWEQCRGT